MLFGFVDLVAAALDFITLYNMLPRYYINHVTCILAIGNATKFNVSNEEMNLYFLFNWGQINDPIKAIKIIIYKL